MRYYLTQEFDGSYTVRSATTDAIVARSDDSEELALRVRAANLAEEKVA